MGKYVLILVFAILAAVGLTLAVAVSSAFSLVRGIVAEMVILAGYLIVGALVADKIAEKRADEEDVEI